MWWGLGVWGCCSEGRSGRAPCSNLEFRLVLVTYWMDGGESVAGESHRKSEGEFECGLDVSSALGMLSAICLCGRLWRCAYTPEMGSLGNPLHLEGVGGCGRAPRRGM